METRQKKRGLTAATQASSGDEGPSSQIIPGSVHKALAQPLLLQIIVDYAMRDEDGDLCPDNIVNLRLTQKSWNKAVSKKLRQNQEPLFRLTLHQNNSLLRSSSVSSNGKLLDQFVNYWNVVKGAMPTFRVQLEEDYFRLENYNSLLNCLQKCASGLVEIDMNVPENGGSFPGILSHVNLPLLKKLTICLTGKRLKNLVETELAHASNVTFLFQSLLTGNESLKQLVLIGDTWDKLYSLAGAQYATLPSTLTSIEISFWGADRILEILTRNDLPNLKVLALGVGLVSISSELLFRILENVRKTLRRFELQGPNYYEGPPRAQTLLRFPVMEQLKTLEIYMLYFELETEIPVMDTLFPKLEELVLYDQTPEMLEKWTNGAPFKPLRELELELVDENKPRSPWNTLPITLETIQSAHLRFPNVSKLSLQLCGGEEVSGLKYIFMEMRQLTSLYICVADGASLVGSDHWDSVLIGAPLAFVAGMRACPEYWNQVELKNDQPSIRMLEELTKLSLEEAEVFDDDDEGDTDEDNSENPLISNLAFVFGFLKMSKLINLSLKGRFLASKEMKPEWEKTGRVIKYSE